MDPGSDGIVGKVLEQMTESLQKFTGHQIVKAGEQGLKWMGREIGHVVHCDQNIKNLEDGVQNLRDQMETVQGRVNRARDNAEEIEPSVSKWLSKAGDMLNQMDQFLAADGEEVAEASIHKRRRVGKEAEDKLKDVMKLGERGKFDSVGHRPPLADTRLFRSTADYYQRFESRAAVLDEIMQALGDDNVYTIGIYGMAGIGKTRMAQDVAKQAKDKNSFDKIVQVSISHNPDLRRVQGELADFLGLKLDQESLAGRASLLYARFKQNIGEEKWEKILVILDDVWGQINIEEVGIPLNDFVRGCKIVITSRTRGVLVGEEVGVEKECQLGVLTDTEAWSFFKSKVGNTIDSHCQELRSVAAEVCRECGGLPLAIVTLGAALNGKKPHEWIDTLNQLKSCTAEYIDGMAAKVYLPVELSYKFLQHTDTKECFLYCCLYPEDAEISIEELVRYGVGARFIRNRDTMEAVRARVSTIVGSLKTSCLLLEGRNENFVKMHDIIRDVAISIASNDKKLKLLVKNGVKKWPDEEELKQCRALSMMLGKIEALPNQLECPSLRTLILKCSDKDSLEVPDGFFKETKKLEILDLHNLRLSPAAWSSISGLVDLRMLCLYGCNLESVGFMEKLEKLEILNLNASEIEALSPEMRKLNQLRVLDFRGCCNLHKISPGIISSLSNLEELYASDMSYETNFDKWNREGNASIEELNSLQHLTNFEACIPAEAWSSQDLQRVSSLIRFKICIGCHFGTFDNYMETRTLKLRGIELIGGAQVLMKKAQALYLNDVKGLQELLRYMDEEWFLDLKFLEINDCEDEMEHLLGKSKWNISGPNSSASPLVKLSKLTISNCRLKNLFSPSIVRCLPQLQEVGIDNCESMVEIVGDDEEVGDQVLLAFPRLKKLKLLLLPNLKSFYASTTVQALFNGKVSFPVLEKLEIGCLESITAIWDSQFDLKRADFFQLLKVLRVWGCKKLVNVVHLQAANDNDETMVFPKLELINFGRLPNLKSFCCNFRSKEKERVEDQLLQIEPLFNHKVSFPVLKILFIRNLESIISIWDYQWKTQDPLQQLTQDPLQQLSMLNVEDCPKLEHLVASHVLPFLQNLETLVVYQCDSVKFLFRKVSNDEILVFPQLKNVELVNLSNLKNFCHMEDMPPVQALFTHEVKLPYLENLKIHNIPNLREVWDITVSTDSFCKLKRLSVKYCDSLVYIAPSKLLKSFHDLRLRVRSCKFLEEIFRVEASNATEEIAANEIEKNFLLAQLEVVDLYHLPSLTSIYSKCCISELPSSIQLKMRNCPILEQEITMNNADGE